MNILIYSSPISRTIKMPTRVKICCISSVEEARLAIRYGASALGLVSDMPSGPGIISDDLICSLAYSVPPYVSSVLLTSRQDVEGIVEQHRHCRTNVIQIVDTLKGRYEELQDRLPGVDLVQVVHVRGDDSIQEALDVSSGVDGILLDSGNQALKVKELGGTGRTHDWSLSSRIVEAVNVPVILAGGLNPENVEEAIRLVKPFAVDVCSGVRTNGSLDEEKLLAFFNRVNMCD